MTIKRVFLIIVLWAEVFSLFAQKDEDYRLKALAFFCANKNEILRVINPIFSDVTPIFILDIRMNDAEELYIDSSQLDLDSLALGYLLTTFKMDYFIVNKQFDISRMMEDKSLYLCDCIYWNPIAAFIEDSVPRVEQLKCKREYGLSLSRVIRYKDFNYVVLRITSFFMARIDKIQFCVVEYSNDGNIIRYGIGDALFVD